uniref:Polyprotein n=1 Tax=Rhizoctonia solani hypovirus 6 TaxID=2818410 RepID=A0AAU6NDM0_9VIRU
MNPNAKSFTPGTPAHGSSQPTRDQFAAGLTNCDSFDWSVLYVWSGLRQGQHRDVLLLSLAQALEERADGPGRTPDNLLEALITASAEALTLRGDLGVSKAFRHLRDAIKRALTHLSNDKIRAVLMSFMSEIIDAATNILKLVGAGIKLVFALVGEDRVMYLFTEAVRFVAAFFPQLRNKPKAAWAPLYRNSRFSFSRLEYLLMQAPLMKKQSHADIGAAIAETRDLINQFIKDEEVKVKPTDTFSRPISATVGKTHRAPAQLIEALSELPVATELIEDGFLTERARRWLARGAPQGVDQAVLATEAKMADSLARYAPAPLESSADDYELADAVAEAMYNQFPDAFRKPKLSSMKTISAAMDMAYSTGIPLLEQWKKRRDLLQNGVFEAVLRAAEHCITTGSLPMSLYHAFPKSQVVLLTKAQAKMRTVVAQDLLTKFVDDFFQFERNKRITWDYTDLGSGLPMNEPQLLPLFQKVNEHRRKIEGDLTEYDANCPVLGQRILERLMTLGLDPGLPYAGQMEAAVRARIENLRDSWIISLPNATYIRKNRGGATGQSATSWDNSWTVKGMFIYGWCRVTGRPPSDFFKENTLYNTSDDNMWGCSTPEFDFQALVHFIEQQLGLKLTIVESEDMFGLSYLGRRVIRLTPAQTAEAENAIGRAHGGVGVIFDPARVMLKRTALVSAAARRPAMAMHEHYLLATAGHMTLVAHNPQMYDWLLGDAKASFSRAMRYAGLNHSHFSFEDIVGSDGLVRASQIISLHPGNDRNPAFRKFQRLFKALPTYTKVLQLHLDPRDPSALIGAQRTGKEHAYKNKVVKALGLTSALNPYYVPFLYNISRFREGMYVFGRPAIKYLMPEVATPLYEAIEGSNYLYERFIFVKSGCSLDELHARAMVGPFAALADVWGFRLAISTQAGVEKVFGCSDPRDLRNALTVKLAIAMLLVWGFQVAVEQGRRLWLLGLLAEIWIFWVFDLQSVYAVLSIFVFLASAQSSIIISSLIKKEQIPHIKSMALQLADLIDDNWVNWLPIGSLDSAVMDLMDWIGAFMVAFKGVQEGVHHTVVKSNPWLPLAGMLVTQTGDSVSLTSGTATGKSTWFIGALIQKLRAQDPSAIIYIATPYKHLRDGFHLGGSAPAEWLTISTHRNRAGPGSKAIVGTTGHIYGLIARQPMRPNDILVLDESHLQDPAMIMLLLTIPPDTLVIAMTATTNLSLLSKIRHFRHVPSGFPDRFNRVINDKVPETDPFRMLEWIHAQDFEDAKRVYQNAMVLLPTIPEVLAATSRALQNGFKAYAWYGGKPPPTEPCLVFCTTVGITGTDLPYPLLHYVSPGRANHVTDQGSRIVNTTRDQEKQGFGRVARKGTGYAWRAHVPYGTHSLIPLPNPEVLINHPLALKLQDVYEIRNCFGSQPHTIPGMPWATRNPTAMRLLGLQDSIFDVMCRIRQYAGRQDHFRRYLAYCTGEIQEPEEVNEVMTWVTLRRTVRIDRGLVSDDCIRAFFETTPINVIDEFGVLAACSAIGIIENKMTVIY